MRRDAAAAIAICLPEVGSMRYFKEKK